LGQMREVKVSKLIIKMRTPGRETVEERIMEMQVSAQPRPAITCPAILSHYVAGYTSGLAVVVLMVLLFLLSSH